MAKMIDSLLKLYSVDRQIRDAELLIERLPAELAESEAALAEVEGRRAALRDQARAKQVEADRANVEIKNIEGKIEKYQLQLNIAKTQKEYDVLKSEIAAAQGQISDLETAALTAYEEAEDLGGQAQAVDPEVAAAQKRLSDQRAALDGRLAELRKDCEALKARRGGATGGVDADALRLYDQVLTKHPDGALVRVDAGICTLCNIKLTPQSWNLVLMGEKPQQCRSCGRICYCEGAPQSATGAA